MGNQAPLNRKEMVCCSLVVQIHRLELTNQKQPLLVGISCVGWVTNHFTGTKAVGQSDVVAGVGVVYKVTRSKTTSQTNLTPMEQSLRSRDHSQPIRAYIWWKRFCSYAPSFFSLLPLTNKKKRRTDNWHPIPTPFGARNRRTTRLCY